MRVVLLVTFGLTLFRSLAEGIVVGFALSALLFLHRMSQSVQVDQPDALGSADGEGGDEDPVDRDTVVFRISGAFFFGAAATVAAALDRIAERPRNYVLDFAAVAMIDSTAATTVAAFVRKQRRRQARVFITGASPTVRGELLAHEVGEPEVDFLRRCRGRAAGVPAPDLNRRGAVLLAGEVRHLQSSPA